SLEAVRVSGWEIKYRASLLGDNAQVPSCNRLGRGTWKLMLPGDLGDAGHTVLPSDWPLLDYPVLTADDVRLHTPQLQWKYPRTLPRFEATRPSDNSSAISSNVQCSRWVSNQLPS